MKQGDSNPVCTALKKNIFTLNELHVDLQKMLRAFEAME
jgi:hypothetical protein